MMFVVLGALVVVILFGIVMGFRKGYAEGREDGMLARLNNAAGPRYGKNPGNVHLN